MLTTKNTESNYLCKVVKLEGIRKHSNADRLQVVNVGMNTVITGLESYKLKSFRFLEKETKQLDKGESDIESEN